jgi:hypothetical protein
MDSRSPTPSDLGRCTPPAKLMRSSTIDAYNGFPIHCASICLRRGLLILGQWVAFVCLSVLASSRWAGRP